MLKGLTIRVQGLTQALAFWRKAEADLSDPWKLVGPLVRDDFAQEVEARYATRGRGSWPKLSEPYATYKRKVRPSAAMMVFDGDLKKSLTRPASNLFHYKTTSRAMEVGSNVGYSGVHQLGDPSINLPARALFVLTPAIGRQWAEWLREKVFD